MHTSIESTSTTRTEQRTVQNKIKTLDTVQIRMQQKENDTGLRVTFYQQDDMR